MDLYLKTYDSQIIIGLNPNAQLPIPTKGDQYNIPNNAQYGLIQLAIITKAQPVRSNCCELQYENTDPMSKSLKTFCTNISMYSNNDPNNPNSLCDSYMNEYCPNHPENPFCSCYNVDSEIAKLSPQLLPYKTILQAQPKCWFPTCANTGYKNVQLRQPVTCSIKICTNQTTVSGDNNILTNSGGQLICDGNDKPLAPPSTTPPPNTTLPPSTNPNTNPSTNPNTNPGTIQPPIPPNTTPPNTNPPIQDNNNTTTNTGTGNVINNTPPTTNTTTKPFTITSNMILIIIAVIVFAIMISSELEKPAYPVPYYY
jgi:hypothetical protein